MDASCKVVMIVICHTVKMMILGTQEKLDNHQVTRVCAMVSQFFFSSSGLDNIMPYLFSPPSPLKHQSIHSPGCLSVHLLCYPQPWECNFLCRSCPFSISTSTHNVHAGTTNIPFRRCFPLRRHLDRAFPPLPAAPETVLATR